MGAKQPIGNNTLLLSLVHAILKRQVVLGKQKKPSALCKAGVPKI